MEKNQKKTNMSPFQREKRCGGLKNRFWAYIFLKAIVCFSTYSFPFFNIGFNDSDLSQSDENPSFLKFKFMNEVLKCRKNQ